MDWKRRVNQIILKVVEHDLSKAHFNHPAPGAPLCFEVVLQRLMDGVYRGPADVHADIQALWTQARAAPGSERAAACERLAPLVNHLWRYCSLEPAQGMSPGPDGSPSLQQQQQQLQQQQMQQQMQQQQMQEQQQQYGRAPALQPALMPQLGGNGWAAMQAQAQAQAPVHVQPGGWGSIEAVPPQVAGPNGGWGSPALTMPLVVPQRAQHASPLGYASPSGANLGPAGLGQPGELPQSPLGADAYAQMQLQMQAAAEAQRQRDLRRLALLRLKQQMIMQQQQGGPSAAEAAQQAALLQQLSGGGGQALPAGPSLAEQQQAWLDAMAQQRPPPSAVLLPQMEAGADDALAQQRLAAALVQQQQQQAALQQPRGGGAASPAEHERQRLRLAQFKSNMLLQLQQRQQGEAGGQLQLQQGQMQVGGLPSFASPDLAAAAAGLPGQSPGLMLQQQSMAGLGSLSLPGLVSPQGSLSALPPMQVPQQQQQLQQQQQRLARQRPALAAQMGAAVKEAQRPGGGSNPGLARGHPLHRCLAVLERVLSLEDAEPFAEPVDAEALGIPDYRRVVTRPMDLGTIRARLAPGLVQGWGTVAYKSPDEVLADVQLTWTNCRRYNAAGSPICAMCDHLETAFCQLWEEAGLGPASLAAAPRPSSAGAAPAAGGRASASHAGAAGRSRPSKQQQAAQHSKQAHHSKQAQHGKHAQQHSKQAARKRAGAGSGASAAAPKRARASAEHPTPAAAAEPAALPRPAGPPSGPLLAQAVQADEQAEVAEEGLALQRLLSPDAAALDAAVLESGAGVAAARSSGAPNSPLLWDPEAAAHAGAAGAGAGSFGQHHWQAGGLEHQHGAPAADPALSRALLHPDRGASLDSQVASLPLLPAAAAAEGLRLPPPGARHLLTGLAAATADITPEQLQQEQRVLAAWQQVQQQRQATLQAMAAADAAGADLARARAELAAAREAVEAEEKAAAAAAAAQQPASPAPHQQAAAGDESSDQTAAAAAAAAAGGTPGSSPGSGPPLRAGDLRALAASVRQSRYAELMRAGLQLFAKPLAAGGAAASNGCSAPLAPLVADAVQCVVEAMSGRGTAGISARPSASDDAPPSSPKPEPGEQTAGLPEPEPASCVVAEAAAAAAAPTAMAVDA